MKEFVKKYVGVSLMLRIVIGLVIGAVLGLAAPGLTFIATLGSVFVGALKAIAPVLVFVLVMSSLANAKGPIGKRFTTVIVLYMLSTLLASVLAITASFVFPVSLTLNGNMAENAAPSGIGEVLGNLVNNMVQNPVSAIAGANYIGILFWSIIFGIGLKLYTGETTKTVIKDLSTIASKSVGWIIQCAPFGIMGLMFSTVSENGLNIFTDYGKLLLLLVGCMLTVALIINPIIASIYLKRNAYPLVFRCLKESGVTAFFTRSSAANIPVNMELCRKLGLDEDFYSVAIPLGATINMDGAAITIAVMTLAAVNTLGISVHPAIAILLSVIATVAACGSSGVAGGSLLLIPMACSLFGISNDIAMEVVAVGFIIGVIQDSVETALNSSGDVMFAATAEFHDRLKRGEEVNF